MFPFVNTPTNKRFKLSEICLYNSTERVSLINAVKPHFDENTVLLVDDSDISKPHSQKLEGLCKVKDGSTGEITDGYWLAGVSALTAKHKQPIPVYSRVYSSVEKDYVSNNTETIKSLKFLSEHFPTGFFYKMKIHQI